MSRWLQNGNNLGNPDYPDKRWITYDYRTEGFGDTKAQSIDDYIVKAAAIGDEQSKREQMVTSELLITYLHDEQLDNYND
jgi:hypothetical protein